MAAPALLMIVFGLPLAAADMPLAPPMDLAATMTPEGIELTWNPPVGASEGVTYAVYRDGTLLDSAVEGLSYVDASASVALSASQASATFYAVTAITQLGESLPATVGFFQHESCIHNSPGQTPPFYVVPEECIGT